LIQSSPPLRTYFNGSRQIYAPQTFYSLFAGENPKKSRVVAALEINNRVFFFFFLKVQKFDVQHLGEREEEEPIKTKRETAVKCQMSDTVSTRLPCAYVYSWN
jgi:hypothetical protein